MFACILCIVIVIILLYNYNVGSTLTENYRQCCNCDDDYRMLDGGMIVSNPYIWPYSGTEDVDRVYQMDQRVKADFGFKREPLIHMTTPDHVILM